MSQPICTVVSKARTRASLIFKCFHSILEIGAHYSKLL